MTKDAKVTKTLILMRHAKSDWADPSLSDHDRPLNARGRDAAPRMADWLAGLELVPDRILSSSSLRTQETVALMTPRWNESPQISFREDLYLHRPDTMLDVAMTHGDPSECLMLVAHNPGTAYLVSELADESMDMPTAAIAIFQVEIEQWCELRWASPTTLMHFMRPKAL